MKKAMRLGPALLTTTALFFLAVDAHAQLQSSAPLASFQGNTSQSTASFQAPDSWEVRWQGGRNLNLSVLAVDGSVVGGGAGRSGAIYMPKGGSYHLQIDYDPMPQLPAGEPAPQTQQSPSPYNPVTANNYGDAPSNTGTPSPYPNPALQRQSLMIMLSGPYTVEVIAAPLASSSTSTAPDLGSSFGKPLYKLPSGNSPAIGGSTPATTPLPSAALPALPTTPAVPPVNLSQDQARAVVLIKGDNGEGTGFLVKTKDGPAVITNQHVLANNPNIKITTNDGLSIDPVSFKGATDRDLAMITIKDTGYSYLSLAPDVTAVAPGDQVVTPGNSEGGEVMLNTNGKVLAVGPDRVEIDNPIYHGNSGGPVFDPKTNQVIGVVTEAIKVDTSDALDKASFASRNSAIQNGMRYFAMRVDNVQQWETIDWKSFQGETSFLDRFDQRSRCLDSFLNSPSPSDNSSQNTNGQQQSDSNSADANLWRQDKQLVQANDQFEDQSGGNVDTGQQMDALRELLGSIVDAANSDVATIQNTNNFYSYDRQRAKEEMEYRQAIKDELDTISNNVSRLGGLPRKN